MSVADDVRAAAAEMSSPPLPPAQPTGGDGAKSNPGEQSSPNPVAAIQPTNAGRDALGRFTSNGKSLEQPSAPTAPNATPPVAEAKPAGKPRPQSWRPTLEEHWAKLPPEVQDEAHRLHTEASKALQQTAEYRKSAERWQRALEPFSGKIPGDPVQYVSSLLPAAMALQHGQPAQKAGVVAQLMKTFGVSESDLVAALDGKVPVAQAAQPQQGAPPAYRDPRVDALLAHMAQQRFAEFSKTAEFLDEPMPDGRGLVREAMADYIDWQATRGVEVSYQQAYDYVIAGHPTITEARKRREEAKAQAERAASTAQAQAASSSVRSEPVVVPPAAKGGGSVHDDVRASLAMLRAK